MMNVLEWKVFHFEPHVDCLVTEPPASRWEPSDWTPPLNAFRIRIRIEFGFEHLMFKIGQMLKYLIELSQLEALQQMFTFFIANDYFVGTVRNLRVPKMRGISWLAAEPVSFSRGALLHGVSK